MDEKILERFLNKKIVLINDENFCLHGRIIGIHDNYIEFFTDGNTRVLSFGRIKEIRPLGGNNYK